MTAIYSLLHMFVDAVCALAMFGCFFEEKGYFSLLLYNFCAFALQMPLGTLLDILLFRSKKWRRCIPSCFVISGGILTVLGSYISPVLLGIGNALFHVGGGVGVIQEDRVKNWNGRGLGVFVAPGAMGLYLGTAVAKRNIGENGLIVTNIGLLLLMLVAVLCQIRIQDASESKPKRQTIPNRKLGILAICCVLVVILRSYVGMAVHFPWKQETILGFISVLAVVLGKVTGGFLAAKFGYQKTAIVTLLIAAIGYCGLQWAPLGLIALFFFNMTMPMTLNLLINAMPELAGFSFGLLTLGLFLGFLPIYFGVQPILGNQMLGCVGCLISIMLLAWGIRIGGKHESISD